MSATETRRFSVELTPRSRLHSPDGMIYCLVPWGLAGNLHERLRHHFREYPEVEVIVERRSDERRSTKDRRRRATSAPNGKERRLIKATAGRRVADRRARIQIVDPPLPLPRSLRRYSSEILFCERLEPASQEAEDADTARIVTRIQAGENAAFSDLYLRYFDRLYAYMRTALRNADMAEDATQNVFASALEALPRYVRRDQPFRAWLFAIARNQAIDILRRQGRIEPISPEELEHSADGQETQEAAPVLEWISDRELLMFVERLPLVQRQVLLMRYLLDLPTTEIADALDRTPETIRRAESRAVAFLRARLAAVGRRSTSRSRAPSLVYRRQAPVLRVRRYILAFRGPTR